MTEHIFPKARVQSFNVEHQENLLKKQLLQIGLAEECTAFCSNEGFVIPPMLTLLVGDSSKRAK